MKKLVKALCVILLCVPISLVSHPIDPTFKSPAQGAATAVWAATSPHLNGLGGLYCEDCNVAARASEPFIGVCDYAVDPEAALKLWKLSANLTGMNFCPDT